VLQGLADEVLLGYVGAGSKAALWELFRRHGEAVRRLSSMLNTDSGAVDRIVEDVFVSLSRRAGHLEDEVGNVRLGLLAMAGRRSGQAADEDSRGSPGPSAGDRTSPADGDLISRLQCLPRCNREELALTLLAEATLTDVATVLHADRSAVGARLRSSLRALAVAPSR